MKKETVAALIFTSGIALAQAPMPALKQVMQGTTLPASNLIFDVRKTVPKDDSEWKAVSTASNGYRGNRETPAGGGQEAGKR